MVQICKNSIALVGIAKTPSYGRYSSGLPDLFDLPFFFFFETGIVDGRPCSLPSLLGFSYSKASQNVNYCCALQLVFAPSIRGPHKHLEILITSINEKTCFPTHGLCNSSLVTHDHWQCSIATRPLPLPRHCPPASVITCGHRGQGDYLCTSDACSPTILGRGWAICQSYT